jgi:putative hydrolase of the HAD superfamily
LSKQRRRIFDLIGFDADDTLWHSEGLYRDTEEKFKRLVAAYGVASVDPTMHEVEIRNLQYYGYGIKGFILSLIESAIVLTEGRIAASDIGRMLDWAKEMQTAPVDLFECAQETVAALARDYALVLVTKGDLLDQEAKLARSGLQPYFRYVEVISEKTQDSYAAILARYRVAPERFLMVGNSLKSDILPVIALGGYGVHIPAHLLWEFEAATPPEDGQRYTEIEHLGMLLPLIERMTS